MMSEHEDGEVFSVEDEHGNVLSVADEHGNPLPIKEFLNSIRKADHLDGGRMEVVDLNTGEIVMNKLIRIASEDKTADNSEIANIVSVFASASGTSFSSGSENPSGPVVATVLPSANELLEILAHCSIETAFNPTGTQLNSEDIIGNVKLSDFDPSNLASPRFDASAFTLPESNTENSVDPEQSDNMPFSGKLILRGVSTTESVPTAEEEAPSQSVFDRATHGLPAALPSYTEAHKEVMRNKIEFMLNNLDIESQTEMIKNIFLHYVKRREACLTMSTNRRDILDDIVKPALGEVVFPDASKDIFVNLDGVYENINIAAQKNLQNWADACEMARGVLEDTESLQDLADTLIKGTTQAVSEENLRAPVVGFFHPREPNNTAQPNEEASGSGTGKQGGKRGKGKGKKN